MTNIDKSKPILVTGATGYVAGWLVKKLLEEGYTVHAAVRDPKATHKIAHLERIASKSKGSIKYFKADLLTQDAYSEAMEGCELVFHTASPFILNTKDPQKELIDPAIKGTENILHSASTVSSVKRVVLTSSTAAIYNDCSDCAKAPNGELTEEVWNTGSSLEYQPYSLSKTLAEKRAWELAKSQDKWDLVSINPTFVMGPPLNPKSVTSESFTVLKQFGDGSMKMGVPRAGFGVVDVRDVAEAHYLAGFTPSAKGRYLTSAHNTDLLEMGLQLHSEFIDRFPLPKRALPKWLVMLVGPMMDKNLNRRYLKNNIDIPFKANNSKIKTELGITFRPLKETMADGFRVLVDEGIVK